MENLNYIRPWPYTRYKAMGGLISDIRPWPYMRGNTVRTVNINLRVALRTRF